MYCLLSYLILKENTFLQVVKTRPDITVLQSDVCFLHSQIGTCAQLHKLLSYWR